MKKLCSAILVVAVLLSVSCVVFAASDTKTSTRNGNTLTGDLSYYASTGKYDNGEMYLNVSWSGSKVSKMVATIEVVDNLTGESLKKIDNSKTDTTFVATSAFVAIPSTQQVTVYGCGEIRDSFVMMVSPTIYATYGVD